MIIPCQVGVYTSIHSIYHVSQTARSEGHYVVVETGRWPASREEKETSRSDAGIIDHGTDPATAPRMVVANANLSASATGRSRSRRRITDGSRVPCDVPAQRSARDVLPRYDE